MNNLLVFQLFLFLFLLIFLGTLKKLLGGFNHEWDSIVFITESNKPINYNDCYYNSPEPIYACKIFNLKII